MKEDLLYGLKVVDKAYTGELISEYQTYVVIADWKAVDDSNGFNQAVAKAAEGDLKSLYLLAIYSAKLEKDEKSDMLGKLGYDDVDEIWQDLADKGFVLAQYVIAQKYYFKHDVNNAKLWHEKAAAQGCTLSQLCLAYILTDEKKYDEALKLLDEASVVAEADMEINYLKGKIAIKKNVISNKAIVIDYFEKAADQGSSAAMNQLFKMYREMPSIRDETKAFKYATMSAELGDETGVDNLCECYEKGIGVTENKDKAYSIIKGYGKNHGFNQSLKNRYERLSQECARDIGTQIAARSDVKPINITLLRVLVIIAVVLTVGSSVAIALSSMTVASFVLCGLLVTLSGLLIFSITKAKKANARIEKVNTYPEVAITYNNGSFFVVTDCLTEIKACDIDKISFVRTQNRSIVVATIVSSIGTIKIKLKNGNTILVEQVTNAPESTKIMKKIIKSLN